jgi:aspartyl-tRNA(Asn)/glutamyl-tRNA(Gln) amidotransferase subunit A
MYTIREIQDRIMTKQISCTELTKLYLDAAAADTLNAYITSTPEHALAAAGAVDRKIAAGESLRPLEGGPVCVKDNISTAGILTTCASRMLEDYVPFYDAHAWTLLKGQGAVLIGKGNMDEFAMGSTGETSRFGSTANPVDPRYVAGGSSSGCAAAVAGNLAVCALGSDTGGSVRLPAAYCGAVGFKPTYGAVSRRGLVAFASSFDQIGPIGGCVEDVAALLDAITGKDPEDMTHRGLTPVRPQLTGSVKGLRVGLAGEFFEELPASVAAALTEAVSVLENAGAEIVKVRFPLLQTCLPLYYILSSAEASSNLGRYDGIRYGHRAPDGDTLHETICRSRSEGFGAEVKRRILLGTYVLRAGYKDDYYGKAQKLRLTVRAELEKLFESCDLLLTPTVPHTARQKGESLEPVQTYRSDLCTVPANIAGVPAVSVPCGRDENGLPIGLQLMGRAFRDGLVLNAAYAYELATAGAYLAKTDRGVRL